MSEERSPNDSDIEAPTLYAAAPSAEMRGPAEGDLIGRYVVLDAVGVGGMGAVYRAYDPKLRREVAIKLLRYIDHANAEAESRLLREAQAMAQLSHPNVVPVYDVDTFEQAVFIAMEYVEGSTLRDWLYGAERSTVEVIAAFIAAGRGLAAAHAIGLVHRDFKPTNVMVGIDGRVRVMDFGLARLTGEADVSLAPHVPGRATSDSLTDSGISSLSAPLTRVGSVMGTPAYMAPEQHRGDEADHRSDQFSFCLALFEALEGTRPFDEESPESQLRTKQAGTATFRVSARRVPRWVQGIVLRGMSPSRADRWQSMSALLLELDRDRRARRRNLVLVAACAAAVVAVAIAATRESTVEPCSAPEDALGGAWDIERRAAVGAALDDAGAPGTSAQVLELLDDFSARWNAMRTEVCRATHVLQAQSARLMDLRNACLDQRKHELSALVDILAIADDKTAAVAVRGATHLPSLEQCADTDYVTAVMEMPADEGQAVRVSAIREELAQVRALMLTDQFHSARPRLVALLPAVRALGYRPLLAEVLGEGSMLDEALGDYEAAEHGFREAYFVALGSGHDWQAAGAAAGLVFVVGERLDRGENALEWAKHADAIAERMHADPSARATISMNIASVLRQLGRFDEAVDHDRRAAALIPKDQGAKLAMALNNLGISLMEAGDIKGARQQHEAALAMRRRVLRPGHSEIAMSLLNLARVHSLTGEDKDAATLLKEAIAILDESLGPEHPHTIMARFNACTQDQERGLLAEAELCHTTLLELRMRVEGAEHPHTLMSLSNLGAVKQGLGKREEALALLLRVQALQRAAHSTDHPDLANAIFGVGTVYQELDRVPEAVEHYHEAIRMLGASRPSTHPELAVMVTSLGNAYRELGRTDEARVELQRAVASLEDSSGEASPDLAQAHRGLGEVMAAAGDGKAAGTHLQRALTIAEASGRRAVVAEARLSLARYLWDENLDRPRARQLARDAVPEAAEAGSIRLREELAVWLAAHALDP